MELGEGKRQPIWDILDIPCMTCILLSVGEFPEHGLLACFNDKCCLIIIKESKLTIVASDLRDKNSKLYFMFLISKPNIKDIDVFLTKQIEQIQL
jgi:hypothetical protein